MKHYDVVIHGAGIAGLALANCLATRIHPRLNILLLDQRAPEVQAEWYEPAQALADFDLRVYALTAASKAIMQTIGVWPDSHPRVTAYEHMHVWDACGQGTMHFDAADIGTQNLGHIIEGRVLQGWLWQALQSCSNVDFQTDLSLESLNETADSIALNFVSGESISCALLVGADGAQSLVRNLVEIDTVGWSYNQKALVAAVETDNHHENTAWQRFLAEGPLAFLPMDKKFSSIVWSVSPNKADALCEMNEDDFLRQLSSEIEHKLGDVTAVGQRASFPLNLMHAQRYVSGRVALIADAAHTVHPLAGQGLNLGLQDVWALFEHIQHARNSQQDIGSQRTLRAYERSRKGDNWLMQGSFDGLKRLFGTQQQAITQIRNLGMNWINQTPPVKNFFSRKAMGR